jgi:hypothetical protein
MRVGLVVLALAACAAPTARGPAWPRSRARDVDGGESLAPRAAARAVAAAAAADDKADKLDRPATDKPAAPTGGAATPATDKPATPAATTSDEPVMTEEIVIEVEDKD